MAGRSIGATLVLKAGEFFVNSRKAVEQNKTMKTSFMGATAKMQSQDNAVKKLAGSLKTMAGTYISVRGAIQGIKFADSLVSAEARIDNINDGLQTTKELNSMIYKAANNARGSYGSLAEIVNRLGANAGSAFDSSAQLVGFAEQIQKRFVIAGAGAEEAKNAAIQLAQGLGAGALRGDELNSVLEQAPNIARAIEKYMGIAEGSIKTVASEGKVTAEVIKNAILGSAAETNAAFEKMPKTFEQIWTIFKNKAQEAASPFITEAVPKMTEALYGFTDMAGKGIGWLKENWDWLSVTLGVVVGGFLAYKTAVAAATVVQWALNGAMTANPVGIIVVAVGALIGGIVMLIKNWDKVKERFPAGAAKVEGCIASIKGAFQSFWEFVQPLWNALTVYWSFIWDGIKNYFGFVWENIKVVFQTALDVVSGMFDFWAAIFRGDWSGAWDAVKKVFGAYWEGIKKIFGNYIEYIKKQWENLKEFLKKPIEGVVKLFKRSEEDGESDTVTVDGSHRGGLPRVPFDGYIARLHKNERVLTAEENRQYISGGNKTISTVFKVYITTNELSDEAVDKFVSKVEFALANM